MAALKALAHLDVPAIARHTSTVIFVHGLGDTGLGWKPVADMFQSDPGMSHIKWVLPHSPFRKVTANGGMEMPSWFDIYSFGFDTAEDESGMRETITQLESLIKAEVDSGVPMNRIVLGGFSQGATMSLLTGLSRPGDKLGGIAVLSGWLPLREKFQSMASPNATSIPIFWGHGKLDPLVKYAFGKASADFLTGQLGIKLLGKGSADVNGLSFNAYDGVGHSTNQQELDDLKAWLKNVVPKED